MRASGRRKRSEAGRETIIVDQIPYQVNKARLIERIAELVNDKKIEGISICRRVRPHGMRIVIELKRDAVSQVVLNHLFKLTPMQESFGMNLLASRRGTPKLLTLRDALACSSTTAARWSRGRTVSIYARRGAAAHPRGPKIAPTTSMGDHVDRAAANPAEARSGSSARSSVCRDPGPASSTCVCSV